jgi:formylglycine-generating enzyme required for sulfatase activity
LAASKHFKAVSGDIVSDTRAGVEWTRADNGSKVNWSEAQSYCRKLGGGWNLPTREQLESLQNKDLPGIPCGQATCVVPNQFKLSNLWFWSSEPNGSSEAWGVSLTNGARGSHRVGSSNGHRALCVRRP